MPIVYFKVSQMIFFLNYDVFLSLKVALIIENSAEPDEMQHYFHLGLHFLPKYMYLFRGYQYTKG